MGRTSEPKDDNSKTQPAGKVAPRVVLKGEKGQYNEILRPSEREDAYVQEGDKVESLRSQTTDTQKHRDLASQK